MPGKRHRPGVHKYLECTWSDYQPGEVQFSHNIPFGAEQMLLHFGGLHQAHCTSPAEDSQGVVETLYKNTSPGW